MQNWEDLQEVKQIYEVFVQGRKRMKDEEQCVDILIKELLTSVEAREW